MDTPSALDGPLVLSDEEFLVVADALNAPTLAGLGGQAWATASPETQAVSLAVAQRALEARGLAMVDDQRQLQLHRALLSRVGLCALAERTVILNHWATAGVAPVRLFAHAYRDQAVLHTVMGHLHTFHWFPARAGLGAQILSACGWRGQTAAPSLTFTISPPVFDQVCEAIGANDRDEALRLLTLAYVPSTTSALFLQALASGPRVTVGRAERQVNGVAQETAVFTLIDPGESGWLMVRMGSEGAASLQARTVATPDAAAFLLSCV